MHNYYLYKHTLYTHQRNMVYYMLSNLTGVYLMSPIFYQFLKNCGIAILAIQTRRQLLILQGS